MRLFIFACFLFCYATNSGAQETYTRLQWEEKPRVHKPDPEFAKESAIYILDKRLTEYVMIEKEGLACYYTVHKIIHLIDDKGIESFNKIYLPVREKSDLLEVRARSIQPDGTIKELSRDNIKDLTGEDKITFKIFAIEGLTRGSEVEYYYTVRKRPSFFGTETFQGQVPVEQAVFYLSAPRHLLYEAKSFNGFGKSIDTTVGEKNILYYVDSKLKNVDEEKYAMYRASLKKIEYKLSYNKSKSMQDRLFSWNELAKNVYTNATTFSKSETKRIGNLLEEINPTGSEKEKVRAIENWLKKNIQVDEDLDAEDDQS
jgi:hypothetical protein